MNRYDYLIVGGNRSGLSVSLRLALVFELVIDILALNSVAKKENNHIGLSGSMVDSPIHIVIDKYFLSKSRWTTLMQKYWRAKNTNL